MKRYEEIRSPNYKIKKRTENSHTVKPPLEYELYE